jgi:hypothetical protein
MPVYTDPAQEKLGLPRPRLNVRVPDPNQVRKLAGALIVLIVIGGWRCRVRAMELSYNDLVSLSLDTSFAIEQRQIEAWRRMSPAEKLQLVSDTSRGVIELSLAGIRRRHPSASERECFLRFACIVLGADVARLVYPDVAQLADSAR